MERGALTELAFENRLPRLRDAGAHAKDRFRNRQIQCRLYAHEHGIDPPEIAGWRWPAGDR